MLICSPLYLTPRDAVNDMALHFLAKMKVLVVRDIEREDIEFISKVRGLSLNSLKLVLRASVLARL